MLTVQVHKSAPDSGQAPAVALSYPAQLLLQVLGAYDALLLLFDEEVVELLQVLRRVAQNRLGLRA